MLAVTSALLGGWFWVLGIALIFPLAIASLAVLYGPEAAPAGAVTLRMERSASPTGRKAG
jgi:hypothetical protein